MRRYLGHPLTVEEAVLGALTYYPEWYANRTEVLHHILVVPGSWYDWDGRGRIRGDIGCPKEIASPQAIQRASMVSEVCRPYPWTSYCLLATMPANARKDWKAACQEIRDVLTKQGYSFEERFT